MAARREPLQEVWRWLPAFRSVAELESVSRAAKALRLSPAAVSRAVARIEAALGQKLFTRRQRQLVLNENGSKLLAGVTEATGQLSRLLEAISAREASGQVRIGTFGQCARALLVRVARRLGAERPKVLLSIAQLPPEVALREIEQRTLDLYVVTNVAVGAPLVATRLVELDLSIYCGRAHPLFSEAQPSLPAVLEHGFVVGHKSGLMKPVWPKSLQRSITLQADAQALDACLAGSHLAVMEKVMAEPYVEQGMLRELPVLDLERTTLVLCRRADADQRLVREVAASITRAAQELATGRR